MTQAQLAEELEVTPGRVSQIFGAEMNLTLATVARVFAAMGFDAVVSAVSMRDGSRIEPRVRIGQRRMEIDAYHQNYVSGSIERPRIVLVPVGESPDSPSVGASALIGRATAMVSSDVQWSLLGRAPFTASAAEVKP